MRNQAFYHTFWARALLLALLFSLLAPRPVRADVAPPEPPPGSGIAPGAEVTEVRMVAEQVTLTVQTNREGEMAQAQTEAIFLMRNLGTAEESMQARFPLIYGEALYYSEMFPEIQDIQVEVDGKAVQTQRITANNINTDVEIPWASFPVTFPPGKDVNIRVTYTTLGFGYEPFAAFKYILETGAGWKDTIGSGDIIVKLPYEANRQNVLLDETTGFSMTSGQPTFAGNEIRWHFDELEPGPEHNFEVSLILPLYWDKVLRERQNTAKNPNDGEAWGRLGKAIKEVIRYPKGYLRTDDSGLQLYPEAVAAYEKAVTLLPKDALWRYGYADLLWSHYLFDVHWAGLQDVDELVKLTSELQQSLALDPNYQPSNDLAEWISYEIPGLIQKTEQGYNFLALTATPTTAPGLPTLTPEPEATSTPLPPPAPSATLEQPSEPAPPEPQPTPQPTASNPLCGGTALLLPLLAGLAWVSSRHR